MSAYRLDVFFADNPSSDVPDYSERFDAPARGSAAENHADRIMARHHRGTVGVLFNEDGPDTRCGARGEYVVTISGER